MDMASLDPYKIRAPLGMWHCSPVGMVTAFHGIRNPRFESRMVHFRVSDFMAIHHMMLPSCLNRAGMLGKPHVLQSLSKKGGDNCDESSQTKEGRLLYQVVATWEVLCETN